MTELPHPNIAGANTTIVILGASGDLTRRLLFPAIHRLLSVGRVDADVRVVGYAIDDWTNESFVQHLHDGVKDFGDGVDDAVWSAIVQHTDYVRGDLTPTAMSALATKVSGSAIFYLALPPSLFGQAASALGEVGLADERDGFRRLVIEKPFGTNTATANALQTELSAHWQEQQLYRIDHFLGKDTVQNMMVFRLANRFVEAIWNSANIAQVQITAAETLGLEGRWRYYDKAGALRDMLQNHLMQLFALCAMEPPTAWDAEVLRNHKVELLHSVRPLTPQAVAEKTIRGQYTAGSSGGSDVVGYRQEPDIDLKTITETYAAIQLYVDNWRWQGVPFSLRSGKRLADSMTEIALQLRPSPGDPFRSINLPGTLSDLYEANPNSEANWIVLRLKPDETIEIDAITKVAGLGFQTERVKLSVTDPQSSGSEYTAYEQLILDVLSGDRSLFIRGDEAAAAWSIVQPILDAWTTGEPLPYPAGSDGPQPPASFFGDVTGGVSWRPIQLAQATKDA